jgi:hypothetical protein
MTDQLQVLTHVTAALDTAGVPYMVTDSVAAGYYGQPRMTRDVRRIPAESRDRARALAHESMFNAIHQDALVKVDFVIRKSTLFRMEEFRRRRRMEIDGHPMWLVAAEDLVLSKLVWRQRSESEVQMRDVRAIIAVQGDRLDWPYVEHWAAVLGVADALERARPRTTRLLTSTPHSWRCSRHGRRRNVCA